MISAIQFGIFAASSGHFLWFPQLLNDVTNSNSDSPNEFYQVCNQFAPINSTLSVAKSDICDDYVDLSVFKITIILGNFML